MSIKLAVFLVAIGLLFGATLDHFVGKGKILVPPDTVHVYHPIKYVQVPKIVHDKVLLHDTTYVDSTGHPFRVLRADTLLGPRGDTLAITVYPDVLPPYFNIDYRPSPVPVRVDSIVVTKFISIPRPINPYSIAEVGIGGALIGGAVEQKSLAALGIGAGLVVIGIITY